MTNLLHNEHFNFVHCHWVCNQHLIFFFFPIIVPLFIKEKRKLRAPEKSNYFPQSADEPGSQCKSGIFETDF